MGSERRTRVVVAKPGLDGHDRGAKVIARALRDAGMEVIYTGLHNTAEDIARACIEEDASVVCLSILSGVHKVLVPEVVKMLSEMGGGNIAVLVGGIIPDKDRKFLFENGCKAVVGPGASLEEITELVKKAAREAAGEAADGG